MHTPKVVVGAHYGLGSWLAQRVTAVILAVYFVFLFVAWLVSGDLDYRSWVALFSSPFMRVATLLAAIALSWHTWVGIRDIYMDYIKPTGLRLALQAGTVILLVAYAVWAIVILWSV